MSCLAGGKKLLKIICGWTVNWGLNRTSDGLLRLSLQADAGQKQSGSQMPPAHHCPCLPDRIHGKRVPLSEINR
jgi:hypothetical protein